jgi:glycosyltransferase involved in cell wall biosynthesis
MKLLVMGNNGHLGGLSVHYKTLVGYLQKEDIELFCISMNDSNEKIFNNEHVKEIVVPFRPTTLFGKLNKIVQLYVAVTKARKFRPDVFVATSFGYGFALIASKLPSNTFKVFQEVHFDATADKLRLKMVNEFDAVATQTRGMINMFKANVADAKPVYFLPCFSKEYRTGEFQQIPSTEHGINIAYFGRLAWNKGLKEFISYTAGVFHDHKKLKFDIYGGGPEQKLIQKEIDDQNLAGQVSLKGLYSDDEFPALITSYHAVILPSTATEGLPLILIEAMRFGRPVFTTTTGAMPEVAQINKKGMLVSEKDNTSIEANFRTFIATLSSGKFDAGYINDIYAKNFSNEAFKNIWLNMLNDPKRYFQTDQN